MLSLYSRFCTLIVLCCIIASVSEVKPRSPHRRSLVSLPSNSWLVYSSPSGYCTYPRNKGCVEASSRPKKLTVHGLWPVDGHWKTKTGCKGYMDPKALLLKDRPLAKSMVKNWPSLKAAADCKWGSSERPSQCMENHMNFWSHEYITHGSCFLKKTPNWYFSTTMKLKKDVGLNGVLAKANIRPGVRFERIEFVNAVIPRLCQGNCFSMSCYILNGWTVLEEIMMCIDRSGKLAQCPSVNPNPGDVNRNDCGGMNNSIYYMP